MRLDLLINAVDALESNTAKFASEIDVTSVTHDSRQVRSGSLFCCVRGGRVDGHEFARGAVDKGAVALLVDHRLDAVDAGVPQVIVADVRAALGPISSAFHGHPSAALPVIGVTGTNGKTTTTWMIKHALDALGQPCGLIGTLTGAFTTPEAPDFQAALARFRDDGQKAIAVEVSSHALAMGRSDGTTFAVGVFTNLTQDHLDLHGSMAAYEAAKARLFEPGRCRRAVVNRDDEAGRRILERLGKGAVSFGISDAEELDVGLQHVAFRWRGVLVRVPIGGLFMVANTLAALTALAELGYAPSELAVGIGKIPPVPGRFEPVGTGQNFDVIVDYAHTPDGLDAVLRAARAVMAQRVGPAGRLTVVFGCGGDRDAGKRPIMGRIASEGADRIIVTSDNPRSEDPAAIISDVLSGIPDVETPVTPEPDRRRAIFSAIEMARPGDVIVIAGKGHEATQTIGNDVLPFDDRLVAREAIAAATGSESAS